MMNTISNMIKYIALPLSFLALSTSQAAQISDKDKSYSTYSFSNNLLVEQTNQTGDDAKDDEKIDYTIKKSTGLGLLPYDQWPKNRKIVYSPSLSKNENNEVLIKEGIDRRRKINKLLLKLLPNKNSFDITCYMVKVHAYFGCKENDGETIEGQGTATIIKIKKGIIYLLTCAHNVIKHEHHPFEGDKLYYAKHVSFFYKGKQYSCNDYYVYPKYVIDKDNGIVNGKKDIAIITSHRGYDIKFPYVSFPQIVPVSKGKYEGHVIGFPGEKEKRGKLYGMLGNLEVKDIFVEYQIDTSKGQSGSPIWAKVNGIFKIIGVHTYGTKRAKRYNCGPLLNNEFIKWEQARWVQVQKVYKKQETQLLTEQLSKKESELNNKEYLIQQLKKQLENKDKRLEEYVKLIQFKGKPLPKDLSGLDLRGYDFRGCAFTYTDLTDTNLENSILTNTTCDYQKAFQDNLKKNKCERGDWYKENLPKDLKSIAEVYPKLKNHADKVKLLHIACGLSKLPFYKDAEFYIKSEYWSCALLQLKDKGDSLIVNSFFYSPKLICSLESDLNYDVKNYCWSTEYPQKDDVNLEEKNPHANFGTYLTHFNNGLVEHKCKSKNNYGFNWYKGNIQKNIKGLQKAYPKIENKELQKEACQIGCALSKSYQIRGMLFLFHYLFYQNRLIRFRNSVGVMVKNDIHYNSSTQSCVLKSWNSMT